MVAAVRAGARATDLTCVNHLVQKDNRKELRNVLAEAFFCNRNQPSACNGLNTCACTRVVVVVVNQPPKLEVYTIESGDRDNKDEQAWMADMIWMVDMIRMVAMLAGIQ